MPKVTRVEHGRNELQHRGSDAGKRAREEREIVLSERKRKRRKRECGRNSPHAITLFLITV